MPVKRFNHYKEFTSPTPVELSREELQNPRLVSIQKAKYIYFREDEIPALYRSKALDMKVAGLHLLSSIICDTMKIEITDNKNILEDIFLYDDSGDEHIVELPAFHLVRLPDDATEKIFEEAVKLFGIQYHSELWELDIEGIKFAEFTEGLCVEALFAGPTVDVVETYRLVRYYMEDQNLIDDSGEVLPNGMIRGLHFIHLGSSDDPIKWSEAIMRVPVRRETTV